MSGTEPGQETLGRLKLQTLRQMGFAAAAKWVGETLLLLMPEPRAVFLPETKDSEVPIQFIDGLIDSTEKHGGRSADDLYDLAMRHLGRSKLTPSTEILVRVDSSL